MSDGTDPLRMLGGVLLLLFGLCLLLVSGLCTVFLLTDLRTALSGGLGITIVTLGTLALGLFAVVQGVRIMRGRG